MTSQIYNDYTRAKIGWFFGLHGWQVTVLAVGILPFFWSLGNAAWLAAALFVVIWAVLAVITVTPVLGRSATGWALRVTGFSLGAVLKFSLFTSKGAEGKIEDLAEPDLPGVLQPAQIHDGPPHGAAMARVAVIQNHATRTWAVTATVVHPGIGMMEALARNQTGRGLSEMLEAAERTELVDEVIFMVRSVPEDGAERDQWVERHRNLDGPQLARTVNDGLKQGLGMASVRTEAYCTLVVPESRIAKVAKESGGGVEGRARALYGLMGEMEAQLRGAMGMTTVNWLTSPELALACRTGFAPGDRAAIIDALGERERDPKVNADIPWAMAGPSGADPAFRHYSHDAWNSISSTIKLPAKGAVMGALAPVLTPGEPGERRSFVVVYPIAKQGKAERQSNNAEWAADVGGSLKQKLGVKVRAKQQAETGKVRGLDGKLAQGNALIHPYAIATVTVAKTQRVAEYGRRLDASIRRAGFAPLRLDLAQDTAFIAATVPMGISLTRRGGG
ncbi:hypothetical protein GCM10011492_09750 [Flexivirga endophytica]|uniref:PrgI family protein n=1 Tax=Flexivirga endophytica TaxID=1849103 RepID=A0A916WR34_9MICO|nr:SCO6880 family protein [Flexivirga endophytica]GGB21910.1 hypothetical protein GCM10011492_09750 [Flexivirga endophytica]GHB59515.1 hypothetical protein GCM10008112_30770 [Flexivirga endophytica]